MKPDTKKRLILNYACIDNITFDGIDFKDCPDYCDAYIDSAYYEGREMTEEELDVLNEDRDFVYEKLMEHLY